MQQPKLLCLLPEEYVCTPDGMEVDKEGNLVLACPNFANISMPSCVCKIDKNNNVTKWFDVPVNPEINDARAMGIAFGPDWDLYIVDNVGWSGDPKLVFKGRMLRVRLEGNKIVKTTVVAEGMEHPNGVRVHGDYLYVTQSLLSKVKTESGNLLSCVYRFHLNDENIKITNTLEDKNILLTYETYNKDDQYGMDGIVFDKDGNMYVGNFGDGEVFKVTFNPDGTVKENKSFAKNQANLRSTDGMCIDEFGNIYVADFVVNAIAKIDPSGKVTRIAQSPDTNGFNGELDQPGEPCIWNGKVIVSCFDLVTGGDKVNTAHEVPATLSMLEIEK